MKSPDTSSRRLPWIGSYGLLVLLVSAWFSPWWMEGRVLAPLDIVEELMVPWADRAGVPEVHNHFVVDGITQYLPYRWISAESLRTDGFIGWNPMSYGGTAHYANTMALCFDWTVQLHRWFDFWTAWHLGLMGQLLIAGCGMLWLLRSQGLRAPAALFGAVAYMGNSQFVTWLFHRWALSSFCWMPLVLWSLLGPTGGRRRAAAPVFIALAFLGGSLQHAAFVVIAVGCVWLAEAWPLRSHRGVAAGLFASRFSAGLLAAGIAAVMFVPCIRAFLDNLSSVGQSPGMGYPAGIVQPVLNAIAYPLYLFPWPLGRPATLDFWKLFKSDLFFVAYLGFLPAVLGCMALVRRSTPALPRLLMTAGLLIPLTPLVAPLYQRVFLLYLLGAAWAGAWILDRADPALLRRAGRWALGLLIAAALGWSAASAALQGRRGERLVDTVSARFSRGDETRKFEGYDAWTRSRVERFVQELPPWNVRNGIPLLLAAAGCGLLGWGCGRTRGLGAPTWAVGIAVALVGAEVSLHRAAWLSWHNAPPTGQLYPGAELTNLLSETVRGGRLLHPRVGVFTSPLYPNIPSVFGVATLRGYDSIRPLGMDGIYADDADAQRLDALAISHLLIAEGDARPDRGWRERDRAQGYLLLEREPAPDRYTAIGLENARIAPISPVGETWNRRELRVPAGTVRVRVAENWHPDWEFRLGAGNWRPTVRGADGALEVPMPEIAGPEVAVELRFRPSTHRWPAALSVLCLGVTLVQIGWRGAGRKIAG